MKYLFPLSFKVNSEKATTLALVCLIYIVVFYLVKFLCGLSSVFVLGFNIISSVVGMYCLMGVIAAILVYMKRL